MSTWKNKLSLEDLLHRIESEKEVVELSYGLVD
jgi:hypothetical protein